MQEQELIDAVRRWLKSMVVDLQLCPFARHELQRGRVRFAVSVASSPPLLLQAMRNELALLEADPSIETTLLIHSEVLQDFADYNQFLQEADGLLVELGLEGVYQVASFHPHYRFAGTAADDAANYTNRSPYPLLHLLREASLERVIAETVDVDRIPLRNIALMNQLGTEKLRSLLQACISGTSPG